MADDRKKDGERPSKKPKGSKLSESSESSEPMLELLKSERDFEPYFHFRQFGDLENPKKIGAVCKTCTQHNPYMGTPARSFFTG